MNRIVFFLCAVTSSVSVSCSVPPDSENENVTEVVEALDGGGACAPGQRVCTAWQGSTQVYGTCVSGSCCLGCVDASGTCRGGDNVAMCGIGGGACVSCSDSNECTVDACGGGSCHHTFSDNDVSCYRGNGRCNIDNGSCCTGVFMSVYDVQSSSNVTICTTSCSGCTCLNAATHECEPALDPSCVCH